MAVYSPRFLFLLAVIYFPVLIMRTFALPVNLHPDTACPPSDVRCLDGKCILAKWRCDGQKDCYDGSDEENCGNRTCLPRQMSCDENRCLPIDWRCDGQVDCNDGSDELPESCAQTCPLDHFRCSDGKCIPDHWKCDGDRDCRGGDDEAAAICVGICKKGEHQCRTGQQCIPNIRVCDGFTDCYDKSDEFRIECLSSPNSFRPVCETGEFRCSNGLCLSSQWTCDSIRDCPDGEDESSIHCKNDIPTAVGIGNTTTVSVNATTKNVVDGRREIAETEPPHADKFASEPEPAKPSEIMEYGSAVGIIVGIIMGGLVAVSLIIFAMEYRKRHPHEKSADEISIYLSTVEQIERPETRTAKVRIKTWFRNLFPCPRPEKRLSATIRFSRRPGHQRF